MNSVVSFFRTTFSKQVRIPPKKIWFFYKEPYLRGILITTVLFAGALAVVLIIFVTGLISSGVIFAVGGLIYALFYAIVIAVGAVGLFGFASEELWPGLISTGITCAIAYAIYNGGNDWVLETTANIFQVARNVYHALNFWPHTISFLGKYWGHIVCIILAPITTVTVLAIVSISIMGSLRGIENGATYIYGINFPCPECGERTEPAVYHCQSCGQEHAANLCPSTRGIIWHNCSACGTHMPTMMLLGRNRKQQRKCPHCSTPLNSVVGIDKHVAFVGGRNTGKTCFLVQSTNYLIDQANGRIPEKNQEREFTHFRDLLRSGQLPQQTQKVNVYRAFQLEIPQKPYPYHVHFYDIAGENFEHAFDTAKQPFYKNLDAVVFILDPYGIDEFRHRFPPPKGMEYSKQDPREVIHNLYQALEKYNSTKRINGIKLHILLVKTDTGYLDRIINVQSKHDDLQARIRKFIRDEMNQRSFLFEAERVFKNVTYHYASALGRTPGNRNRKAFKGKNVRETLKMIFASIGIKSGS